MTEPTTTSTAAAAASALTVAGVATGLPADLLLPAFCGALWALRSLDPGGTLARVAQVVAGTLLSAWSTPALSLMAAAIVPAAAGVDPGVLRYPIAALLGWGGIGIILPRLGRWMGGEEVVK